MRSTALAALDLARPFSIDDAVTALRYHVEENEARSVTMIGLSIGAMIAVRYAARHHVASLVLSGGQVRPPRLTMAVQRLVLGAAPERYLGLPDEMSKKDLLSILDTRVDLTLAEGIRGAQLRIVVGGGHQLATDMPGPFAEAVRAAIDLGGDSLRVTPEEPRTRLSIGADESVCTPGSVPVPGCPGTGDGHPSRPCVAAGLERSTRLRFPPGESGGQPSNTACLTLLQVGFT